MTGQPFSGFPAESIQFFTDLRQNNTRTWFEAHKQTYVTAVQKPALSFVEALGERLQAIRSGISFDTRTNGSGSVMRIYRDVRFSKDKSPYKTNLGIVFWEGEAKNQSPAYYFHLDADGAFLYSGVYEFSPPVLAAYREAVADERLGRNWPTR